MFNEHIWGIKGAPSYLIISQHEHTLVGHEHLEGIDTCPKQAKKTQSQHYIYSL